MAPGRPKQGSFGLGTHPLMALTAGAEMMVSSDATSMRRAVEVVVDAPVEAEGTKAVVEPTRAARMVSFILRRACVWAEFGMESVKL